MTAPIWCIPFNHMKKCNFIESVSRNHPCIQRHTDLVGLHDFLALFDDAIHRGAGLGFSILAQHFKSPANLRNSTSLQAAPACAERSSHGMERSDAATGLAFQKANPDGGTMNSPSSLLLTRPFEKPEKRSVSRPALFCFSHLRWDFVHQRPQHLLNEAAASYHIHFIEEPEFSPGAAHYRMRVAASGVTVLTPVFDVQSDHVQQQKMLVEGLQRSLGDGPVVHWYYTPMALRFARNLPCDLCVYDCMDELSAFRFAPPEIAALEAELLVRSDLVFTGGKSLFEAKRKLHADVHCFPSSVDVTHFARARTWLADPQDQAAIPQPRIGYVGVIDERIDLGLIAAAAAALPDVQFVMVGPIAKIDAADLPQAANIHWLGRKDYDELPGYMANWQSAWMPFALNEATRFISPTKTPEYLAAGLRVTATAVADVVETYGTQGLVAIGDVGTIAATLKASLGVPPPDWRKSVDRCLALMSWSGTWAAMQGLMAARLRVSEKV